MDSKIWDVDAICFWSWGMECVGSRSDGTDDLYLQWAVGNLHGGVGNMLRNIGRRYGNVWQCDAV